MYWVKSEKWEKNIFYLILDVRSPALHSLVAARSPSFSSSFSCSSIVFVVDLCCKLLSFLERRWKTEIDKIKNFNVYMDVLS